MKGYLSLLVLIITSFNSFGQQNNMEGRTYVREASSACKSFKDGGCLITTFETFTFDTDSVSLNYYTIADCDVESLNLLYEKNAGKIDSYSYQIQKKRNSSDYIIRIHGYKSGSFETTSNKLIEFINDPTIKKEDKMIFTLQK